MKRLLLALSFCLGFLLCATQAQAVGCTAATCYWIGGTGTWDSTSTSHWSASSGGASCTCVPGAGDSVRFDANSGGGTVTTDSSIASIAFGSMTHGAFTGTITINNHNMSFTSWSGTGTGTRTVNLGSGTITVTQNNGIVWDYGNATNLTFNAGTSTVRSVGTLFRQFSSANLTYYNITIDDAAAIGTNRIDMGAGGANYTVSNNLTFNNVSGIFMSAGTTTTISGNLVITGGTSTQLVYLGCAPSACNSATISIAGASSFSWAMVQDIIKSGAGSITCTNCYSGGGNTSVTITNPSSGSGGRIIGG